MRPWFLSLLLGGLFLQPAAAQVAAVSKDTIATVIHYQLPGADCALFPASMSMWEATARFKPTGNFTPTEQQVLLAESLLAHHLHYLADTFSTTGYGHGCEEVLKNLLKYRRQYFGFYNRQHQPCLGVNCFLDSKFFESQWLQYPVEVEDGGTDFWRIYFNLATRGFFGFNYNSIG